MLIDSPSFFLRPVLLPFLARNLHLSIMADSIKAIHAHLADEFLSRHFTVGCINFLESIEGGLVASFGRNLPMTDSNFVVAKVVVFGTADMVAGMRGMAERL